MRYLSQRFAMPNRIAMGTLNDIGTEELGHLEMVSTIVHQLTRNLSMEEIEKFPAEQGGDLYLINGNMTKLEDAGLFGTSRQEAAIGGDDFAAMRKGEEIR